MRWTRLRDGRCWPRLADGKRAWRRVGEPVAQAVSTLNPDGDEDVELYFTYAPVARLSPDPALDADLDFVAHARSDVPRLVAEIRRLRNLAGVLRSNQL